MRSLDPLQPPFLLCSWLLLHRQLLFLLHALLRLHQRCSNHLRLLRLLLLDLLSGLR